MDRYEEAMNRMLQWEKEHPDGYDIEEMKSFVFPELKESEDERIRKWLIDYFDKVNDEVVKEGRLKIIAYLEKQKEQQPTKWSDTDNIGWDEAFACVTRAERTAKNEEELQNAVTAEKWLKEIKFKYCVHPVKQDWSEDDEHRLNQIIDVCDRNGYPILSKWLKFLPERFNLQPKVEWSEEDVRHLYNIIFAIKNTHKNNEDYKVQLISWLISLRPQPHWKPSEEQMEALMRTITWLVEKGNHTDSSTLADLRRNLQKLMKYEIH